MASIVQRNKSFSVVYTVYDGGKKKQKWETYHSYEAALRRKEQLDLVQQHEKERAQYREGTLAQFLEEYVELYGRIHWGCTTYTSNEGPHSELYYSIHGKYAGDRVQPQGDCSIVWKTAV